MPINFFGYSLQKNKAASQEEKIVSFAPPENDDGAAIVQGGLLRHLP